MDPQKFVADNYGSAYGEQLRRGFRGLHFTGLIEKEFRESYVAQNLPRARLSGLIALIIVLAVTCIDLMLGTATEGTLNTLRLGLLCPLLVAFAIGISVPAAQRYYTEIIAVGVTVVGLVVTLIAHLGALQGSSYVLAGLVLVVLYGCLFLGLLFSVAMSVTAFLIAAHFVTGIVVGLPFDQLYYSTAILGGAAVIGGISTYNLEHSLRTNFLETRMLNELAERDGLTGLYNRRIFDDYVERLWRQSRREGTAVAIVFVDIDSFKSYNDLYGHQAGDDCLKKVAKCIGRGAKRPFDFAARYGGEEFVLVLYGPPEDYARSVPEQIRRDVLDLAIPHGGSQVAKYVTVSLGLSLATPDTTRSLAGAIQTADEALYQAKREGRNLVVFKDSDGTDVETGNFRVIQRDLA
jgi:diguanylate cyclase (GGDEF)-like protein